VRINPWQVLHKRIEYVDKSELSHASVDELLERFNLNWQVELWDVNASNGEESVHVPNRYATVAVGADSVSPLSVVGGYYKPTQNKEFVELLTQVRNMNIAEFVALGSANSGRYVYAVMELNNGVNIPGDPHAGYLIARTSHDGSCSLTVSPLIMRIMCTNAINASVMRGRHTSGVYTARHTLNTNLSYDSLIAQMNLSHTLIKDWSIMANRLIDSPMSDEQFESLKDKCFAFPAAVTSTPNNMWSRSDLVMFNKMQSYRDAAVSAYFGKTQENLYGTRYGGLQAIIEAVDHRKEMSESQARAIILDKPSVYKQKALELVTVGA
jgi:hypothetical protein